MKVMKILIMRVIMYLVVMPRLSYNCLLFFNPSSNDNRPVFEKHRCAGYLSRQAPIGSPLVVLSAIDFDTSDIISYRIVDGNRDDCFRLAGRSGKLTLNCDLNQRIGQSLLLRNAELVMETNSVKNGRSRTPLECTR